MSQIKLIIGLLKISYKISKRRIRKLRYNLIILNFLYKTKKSPNSFELGLFSIGWQLPTLPDFTLVPSAQLGLTSLFEMGRGGP